MAVHMEACSKAGVTSPLESLVCICRAPSQIATALLCLQIPKCNYACALCGGGHRESWETTKKYPVGSEILLPRENIIDPDTYTLLRRLVRSGVVVVRDYRVVFGETLKYWQSILLDRLLI